MMLRRLCFFAFAALTACATQDWVKPDTPQEQADRDNVDCQRQASREATLRAGGYYGPEAYGPYAPAVRRQISRPDPVWDPYGFRQRDEAQLTDLCMRAKGYQRQ
jgi:hypothetical protein